MEKLHTSETSVYYNQTTWPYTQKVVTFKFNVDRPCAGGNYS
jgi:hypothetical protein